VSQTWLAYGCELRSPQYSHPSFLFFATTFLTLIMHVPIFLLTHLNTSLRRNHSPLIVVPFVVTGLTLIFTLLSNYLVRRARYNESQRIVKMLTDAAGRERSIGDEGAARAMVGIQGSVWGRIVGFLTAIAGLVAGLAGLIVVTVSGCLATPLTSSYWSLTCLSRPTTLQLIYLQSPLA
jgi:glycerol uptake facilitator-like aquaporin